MAELLLSDDLKSRSTDICPECEGLLVMPADPTQKPNHECGVIDELANDYDWKEAFGYGDGEWCVGSGKEALPSERFDRTDVAEVLASDTGENDGPEWLCLGRLKNGNHFFLAAGCDYTGWDCQAGGRAYLAPGPTVLVQFVLTGDEKDRLKAGLVKHGLYIPATDTTGDGEQR